MDFTQLFFSKFKVWIVINVISNINAVLLFHDTVSPYVVEAIQSIGSSPFSHSGLQFPSSSDYSVDLQNSMWGLWNMNYELINVK